MRKIKSDFVLCLPLELEHINEMDEFKLCWPITDEKQKKSAALIQPAVAEHRVRTKCFACVLDGRCHEFHCVQFTVNLV